MIIVNNILDIIRKIIGAFLSLLNLFLFLPIATFGGIISFLDNKILTFSVTDMSKENTDFIKSILKAVLFILGITIISCQIVWWLLLVTLLILYGRSIFGL